jgi:hypothetical protein
MAGLFKPANPDGEDAVRQRAVTKAMLSYPNVKHESPNDTGNGLSVCLMLPPL